MLRLTYLGFVRRAIQSYLIFMALNLKRLMKLVAGVSFRAEVEALMTGQVGVNYGKKHG